MINSFSNKLVKTFLLVPFLVACSGPAVLKTVNTVGYSLTSPDKIIILPYVLREISGMTVIDSSSIACVQDEKGVVYIFDVSKDEIKKQIYINSGGDYEGITLADQTLYILRSDAVLFRVKDYESSSFSEKINLTGIKASDNEGLCFDKINNRLLIAPKSKTGEESKKVHLIYGYNLVSDSLDKRPAFIIDLKSMMNFMVENKVLHVQKNKKKVKNQEAEINFKPSEIGIHPVTNKLFVLCGEERMLFVFDSAGTIEYAEKLDPALFNKPEGLTFFKNGDLLISNEAGNGYPTILRFNYRAGKSE